MANAKVEQGWRVRSTRAADTIARAATIAPLIIRLPVGIVILAHGIQKLMGLGATAGGMEAMGFAPGMFWAVLGGLVETLGGAGLLFGLLTRLAALLVFGMQLIAMLVVHLPNGFFMGGPKGDGIEYNLVLLGALGALIVLGSGTVGVDAAIRRGGRLETTRRVHTGERVDKGETTLPS